MDKESLSNHPELRLVWPALIGCGIGVFVGSWLYPDIGSILGAIGGIIMGILVAELIAGEKAHEEEENNLLDDPNLIVTLDISKEAKAFFSDVHFRIQEDTETSTIRLPSTTKKVASTATHDQEYTLRIFEQAVTSRKTGVFPHRRKK